MGLPTLFQYGELTMKKQKKYKDILILCFLTAVLSGCGPWNVWNAYEVSVSSLWKEGGISGETVSGKISEGKETVSDPERAIEKILDSVSGEIPGGYPAEKSFFLWFFKEYGEEHISVLKKMADSPEQDAEIWYQITGKSIHILWTEYCKNTGQYPEYAEIKLYEKECGASDRIVLDFTGDINLAEGWSTTKYLDGRAGGIQECISPALREEMKHADILMLNNEFTFSTRGKPLPGKRYTFRANPERVSVLQELEADIVSLANNHVFDFGEEALLDTLDTLKKAEIPTVGAGRNLEEAMEPVYFAANGRKIAIVSATQIERSASYTREATETGGGVLKTRNPDKFLTVIEKARKQSDHVIVFVHWGTENTSYYGKDQTELGAAFIEAGADVVVGGHTHCLQGFDFYNEKPIIYSLGNFWFNNRKLDTGIFQVIIHTDDNQVDVRFLPCIQRGCTTSLTEDPQEKQRILDFMQKISAPGVQVDPEGYVIR